MRGIGLRPVIRNRRRVLVGLGYRAVRAKVLIKVMGKVHGGRMGI
jgi:hypothetical protein